MKSILFRHIFLLITLLASGNIISAQEKEMITPYLQLQYFKDTNEKSFLKATLTYSRNRMENPLPGMKIIFNLGSEKKPLVAEVETDSKGVAILEIDLNDKLNRETSGAWLLRSEFAGNDTIEAASGEVQFMELKLEMELSEPDSVKTVSVSAEKYDGKKFVPAAGEMVTIYVPRMFSFLPVGEISLDDAGSGILEFPSDLPGDKDGILTVIAKVDDHPDFGTIEKKADIKWGKNPSAPITAGHRALWTKTAPKWMIYTLTVLLTGVWAHYLFAIISLIRIKRNGPKQKKSES